MLQLAFALLIAVSTTGVAQDDVRLINPVLRFPPPQSPPPVILPPRSNPRSPIDAPDLSRTGLEGPSPVDVRVLVKVEPTGRVSAAAIMESSGYLQVDDAVLETVRKWKLLPATADGKPIAMVSVFTLPLKLK